MVTLCCLSVIQRYDSKANHNDGAPRTEINVVVYQSFKDTIRIEAKRNLRSQSKSKAKKYDFFYFFQTAHTFYLLFLLSLLI